MQYPPSGTYICIYMFSKKKSLTRDKCFEYYSVFNYIISCTYFGWSNYLSFGLKYDIDNVLFYMFKFTGTWMHMNGTQCACVLISIYTKIRIHASIELYHIFYVNVALHDLCIVSVYRKKWAFLHWLEFYILKSVQPSIALHVHTRLFTLVNSQQWNN